MASSPSIVDYLVEQLGGAGRIAARKMFGEYAFYRDGKLVALVCDDQLFVKPTAAGRAYVGMALEASPYPGAKPCLLIAGERWDDPDWLTGLFDVTAAHLPAPAPRKRRTS